MLPTRNQTTAPKRKPAPKPFQLARNIISLSLLVLLIANLFIQTGHSTATCTINTDGKPKSCDGGDGTFPPPKCSASAFSYKETSKGIVIVIDCPWSSTVSGVTYLAYLLTVITCILFLPRVNIKSATFLLVSSILCVILLAAGISLMISDIIHGHDYYTHETFKRLKYSQTWYIVSASLVGIMILVSLGQAIFGYKLYTLKKKGKTGGIVSAGGGVTIGGSENNRNERYNRMN